MKITHELAARQMLTHLSAALNAVEKAAILAPDEWDKEHISPIYDALEGLICEIKEESE